MDITDARLSAHAAPAVTALVNGCRTALRRRSRARRVASLAEPPAESAEALALPSGAPSSPPPPARSPRSAGS